MGERAGEVDLKVGVLFRSAERKRQFFGEPAILIWPLALLRQRWTASGVDVVDAHDADWTKLDVLVAFDLDRALWQRLNSLPDPAHRVLVCIDSLLLAPISHHTWSVFDRMWSQVLTWNTSFASERVRHFSIPSPIVNSQGHGDLSGGSALNCYKKDWQARWSKQNRFLDALKSLGAKAYNSPEGAASAWLKSAFFVASDEARYPGYFNELTGVGVQLGRPTLYVGNTQLVAAYFPGSVEVFASYDQCLERIRTQSLAGRPSPARAQDIKLLEERRQGFLDLITQAIEKFPSS